MLDLMDIMGIAPLVGMAIGVYAIVKERPAFNFSLCIIVPKMLFSGICLGVFLLFVSYLPLTLLFGLSLFMWSIRGWLFYGGLFGYNPLMMTHPELFVILITGCLWVCLWQCIRMRQSNPKRRGL